MNTIKCRRDTTKTPCLWVNVFGEYVMEFTKDDETTHAIFKKSHTEKLNLHFFEVVSKFLKEHDTFSFDWDEFRKYVLLANKQHIQAQFLISDEVFNDFFNHCDRYLTSDDYKSILRV
jgi:hypothetical protein